MWVTNTLRLSLACVFDLSLACKLLETLPVVLLQVTPFCIWTFRHQLKLQVTVN